MALTPFLDALRESGALEDPSIARIVEVPLFVPTPNLAGAYTATYKIPGDMRLMATGLRGHISGALVTTVDTLVAAAVNARVMLRDQDSQIHLFDQTSGSANYIRLSDIMPGTGKPFDWSVVPSIWPAGHTLRLDITLDNVPGAVGEFGVIISGVLASVNNFRRV